MEIVNLLPLAQAEIHGHRPEFLKPAFEAKLVEPGKTLIGKDLVEAVLIGGYPEMLRRKRPERPAPLATTSNWDSCFTTVREQSRSETTSLPLPCPACGAEVVDTRFPDHTGA
jgi:hypothetical protein